MIGHNSRPSRPVLRWLGGKYRLAPWIIGHFPDHRIYLEPFGGGASVLLAKAPAYNDIYNDLDGELVNLFTVLREQGAELIRQLRLTPYAEVEYWRAFEQCDEPLERARRTLVRSHMGHGTGGARIDRPTGFRTDGVSGSTNVAGEWAEFPDDLPPIIHRLRRVNIMQRPALELIARYSDPKVLIYLDPPYLPETRSAKSRKRRQERGSLQIMGPCERLVLMTPCRRALFAWRKHQIRDDGQTGVECSIFRNEGAGLSSDLIRAADVIADQRWPGERHFTFVNPRAVANSNPGRCFVRAGWRYVRAGPGKHAPRARSKRRQLLILERIAS